MNSVLRALTLEAGGSSVEHGIVKAKQLLKDGVNPDMLRHALGIYLTHSRDAQKRRIVVPSLREHASMRQIAAAASANTLSVVGGQVVTPDTQQGPAILAYWREDYDYNDHHIHWHTVFPGTGVIVDGKNVPVIDRQGELFLYMHSQMVARYETEGICWNLPLVRPWNQYDDVLEYGYVPMPGFVTSYGGYPPFSSWYAVRNPNIPPGAADGPVPRATLELWRDNIYQAIRVAPSGPRTQRPATEGSTS
jgi:tyrosinase